MGRRNKSYSIDLKQQIYRRLTSMLRAGENTSKMYDKIIHADRDKIYSYSTFKSYWKHCKEFSNYIRMYHPTCTTLPSAKKYVKEWLQSQVDNGGKNGKPLSAYTISLKRQAVNKLFRICPDDKDFFVAPKRRRADITRSRVPVKSDKHFSEKNNYEFVNFCKATGCRRNVIEKLKGCDLASRESLTKELEALRKTKNLCDEKQKHLMEIQQALDTFPDRDYFLHHRKDKGGKSRYAPIIGEHVDEVIRRMKSTASEAKVWLSIPKRADIHSYRSDYCNEIYRLYARPIDELSYYRSNSDTKRKYQSDLYCCRGDEAGKRYDRLAMMKASIALGHSRLSVIAGHYLRGI